MRGLVCARCEDVLPGLQENSVDLIVTDPPYGWSFMGKDWDRAVPSVDVWRECLRVLKPGAFAFVMSGPRMDCLSEMGRRLAEAGFETSFSPIFHCFAQGFPKAQNIGKAVDKRLGAEREVVGAEPTWYPDSDQWGTKTVCHKRNPMIGVDRTGQPEKALRSITAPATPEAQALDGSYAGFQPKPAVEVVIVAMKPLAHGTYVDQALDNGKGVTWLDECRIPHGGEKLGGGGETRDTMVGKDGWDRPWRHDDRAVEAKCERVRESVRVAEAHGRFPANLLVSDDALDDGREHASGKMAAGTPRRSTCGYRGAMPDYTLKETIGDSGSFSRYFSLDAWWQAKLSQLPESVQRTFPFMAVPKAPGNEKWFLCRICDDVQHSSQKSLHDDHNTHCHTCGVEFNNTDEAQKAEHKGHKTETNILMHPTQKPVSLFAYLITLGSRPGDLVADFYGGAATMPVGAKMLGRDWLMVEINEEWCRIGERRMGVVQEKLL